MGGVKIRYYSVRPCGQRARGYWQPTRAMREAGFGLVACGNDGPEAWRIAESWNERWDAFRKGGEICRWPPGSLGAAFEEFRKTNAWSEKAPRTREDWERGWAYIGPIFGRVKPGDVTLAELDLWYADITRVKGIYESWRALKIWRALWTVAASLKCCRAGEDPSRAIRRKTPPARQARWTEGEIIRLAKIAIRRQYLGLACVIAVCWDASFSPVDVRKLTFAQMEDRGSRVLFHVGRAKTGRAAIGTLSPRASRLVRAYIGALPGDHLPSAVIFRNRAGRPYSKDTLGDDFRDIRGDDEARRLADMRRSGALEALAGGASDEQIGAKLANSVATNEALRRTYMPVEEAVVRTVDEARKAGRRAIRKRS